MFTRALAVRAHRYYSEAVTEEEKARLFALSLKHEAMATALAEIYERLQEFDHLDLKVLIEKLISRDLEVRQTERAVQD